MNATFFALLLCVLATVSVSASSCLEWVLGYSGESCSATCAKISKTCSLTLLQSVTTSSSFNDVVSASHIIGKTESLGSSAQFCLGGINSMPFATSPAAIQYVPGPDLAPQYLCFYPENGVTGNCDTEYSLPPVQRFCPCDSATC